MKNEVIKNLASLITGAFGLVAALAWNTAIQSMFQIFFGTASSLIAMVLYAIIVTIIAVVATVWIGRIAERSTGKSG